MKQLLMRDAEAAEMLGMARSTFWRLVAPSLPVIRLGRITRFHAADIDAYAAAERARAIAGQHSGGQA